MTRTAVAVALALAMSGCAATPKDGEKMEGDVRMQPVAVTTDGNPARCSARAMLMHRSRVTPAWTATIDTPGTLYVPRDTRVVELTCRRPAGGMATSRYLTSAQSAEGKGGQAATGAMFLLLGGLPALATGMAQRTDVYEYPAAVSVSLPSGKAGNLAAFRALRTAEIERDTADWRRVRRELCDAEQSPGASAMDEHCERGLAEVAASREQMIAELSALQAAGN